MDTQFDIYESHINYFVHFYSDFDIFGMNNIQFMDYKYRENFEATEMSLFEKFILYSNPLTEATSLIDLQKKHPDLFSNISKASTCYIELDVHCDNIINNVFDAECSFSSGLSETYFDSLGNLKQFKDCFTFSIQITKALEALWKDEQERRTLRKLKHLDVVVSYTKNIEATSAYRSNEVQQIVTN